MQRDTNFELRRLLRLLNERLGPGCKAQTLGQDELEGLKKEIHWEGDKIYVEVMKVMCRGYSDEHMRRYLEVHLEGAEYLQARVVQMIAQANVTCVQL